MVDFHPHDDPAPLVRAVGDRDGTNLIAPPAPSPRIVPFPSKPREPCKGKVSLKEVRAFLGARAARQYERKVFATTTTFGGRVLEEFGGDSDITLIDGPMFLEGIEALGKENAEWLLQRFTEREDFHVPTCPACDVKMVRRTTKRGRNAAREFWGCPNYGAREAATGQCRVKFYDAEFPDFGGAARASEALSA